MANWQERIECDPKRLCGKPVVIGTRISVGLILELIAEGMKPADLVHQFPSLSDADIEAALRCGAALAYTAHELPKPEEQVQ